MDSWIREYPQPEQVKIGSAEHLSFDEFQVIHLSLHLTITPLRREGGTDRRIVAANALREAFEFGNATMLGLYQPVIQVCASTFCQHRDKSLTELVGGLQISVSLSDMFDLLALLLIKLCCPAHTEPGGPCRGHPARQLGRWW